jgi:exosortase
VSDVTASEIRAPGALQARTAGRLALILGFWAAVALLYWPSTLKLHRLWTNWGGETYTHGYLILLLSIWLIVRDRRRLALTPVRPQPLALISLALMSVMWVWLWRAALQEPQLMLLPLILYAALFAALGRRMARALAFPIGFLYFAMPFWGDINFLVQRLSAKAIGVLIWITGLPAYMDGVYVHLPGGAIEIARSCSGLHEFIVGLALAALYGKLSDEPWRRRLQWLGLMGILSLAVNWVRIFTVVVAAYETDMRSSLVKHHYWLGWWLFAFVFAGFLWWTGRSAPSRRTASSDGDRDAASASSGSVIGRVPVTLTIAVLAAMPVLAYAMDWANTAAHNTPMAVRWPAAPAGWTGPAATGGSGWKPHFIDPSGQSLTAYIDPAGAPVEAFAVGYRVQTQHAKLLSYWNHLLGSRKRGIRRQATSVVNSPAGRWQQIVADSPGGSRSLVWVRYRIGNRLFVDPRLSQLWYGLEAIVRPPASSLTALRTACRPDCGAAQARLSAAAAWLRPTVR